MPSRRSLIAASIVLACAGSAAAEIKDAPPPPDRSYVLIGVEPEDTQLSLLTGRIDEDGDFRGPIIFMLGHEDWPVDGFFLVDAKADSTMALVQVGIGRASLFGVPMGSSYRYNFCEGPTLAFDAPAGKVRYLTHIRFTANGSKAYPQMHNDLEAARAFMAAHYPALAPSLEQGDYRMAPTTLSCNSLH